MKYLLISLTLATTGCAELHQHALGTRVHSFNAGGVEFVHCSILMDRAKPQLSHDAIQVCQDEVQAQPVPQRR